MHYIQKTYAYNSKSIRLQQEIQTVRLQKIKQCAVTVSPISHLSKTQPQTAAHLRNNAKQKNQSLNKQRKPLSVKNAQKAIFRVTVTVHTIMVLFLVAARKSIVSVNVKFG